jgi:hypothetical protein
MSVGIKHKIKEFIIQSLLRLIAGKLLKKEYPTAIVLDEGNYEVYGVGEGGIQSGVITENCLQDLYEGKFDQAFKKATDGLGKSFQNKDVSFICEQSRYNNYITCKMAGIAGRLDGDFVSIGVSWGVQPFATLEYTDIKKDYYLVDTWEGHVKGTIKIHPAYCKNFDAIRERFKKFRNVKFIRGFAPECLDLLKSEKISFLQMDTGNAEAEVKSMELLWPRIVSGGIVVVDYYSSARHVKRKLFLDMLSKLQGQYEMLATLHGQLIVFKI